MFAFFIVLYVAIVAAAAAWLLLPDVRDRLRMPSWGETKQRLRRIPSRIKAGRNGTAPRPRGRDRGLEGGDPSLTLSWLAPAALLLLAVPATALWLRQHHAYDGFDHTASRETNAQVAALLRGEQLVPPAPLPPELFLTAEVQRERPAISTASRHWERLDAEFRNRLLAVYRVMKEDHGIEMVLLEGHRSPERQAQLAAMGPQVTHAGAGESYHQYGLAADSAFLFDGRIVISEKDPRAAAAYILYGDVAQSAGLVWGGAWRTLKDLGHVELRRPGVLRAAKAAMATSTEPSTTKEAAR